MTLINLTIKVEVIAKQSIVLKLSIIIQTGLTSS